MTDPPNHLELVVPAHNEEAVLETNVTRLYRWLSAEFPGRFQVSVVDNASSDRTLDIAIALSKQFDHVVAMSIRARGRGAALRHASFSSTADILAYVDADLPVPLDQVRRLVVPLLEGSADLVIGSRMLTGSHTERTMLRKVLSRGYNQLARRTLGFRFSDLQCGFKAARRAMVQQLLPQVVNDRWFFDTELLFVASRAGLRIQELPVDWVETRPSKVHLMSATAEDLAGIWRLRKQLRSADRPLRQPPVSVNGDAR